MNNIRPIPMQIAYWAVVGKHVKNGCAPLDLLKRGLKSL
jgi:hypothetical protein